MYTLYHILQRGQNNQQFWMGEQWMIKESLSASIPGRLKKVMQVQIPNDNMPKHLCNDKHNTTKPPLINIRNCTSIVVKQLCVIHYRLTRKRCKNFSSKYDIRTYCQASVRKFCLGQCLSNWTVSPPEFHQQVFIQLVVLPHNISRKNKTTDGT